MCVPKSDKDEIGKPIDNPAEVGILALLEEWHEDFVDPTGIYETEEEEYLANLGFVPDWENTDNLIQDIEQLINGIREQRLAIPEALLSEYMSDVAQYREYKLLPRDAYPRLTEHQYQLINLTINSHPQ
uniref:Uncharacterized protein n=1 Tax=Anopheles culicifacies TaxID=139723 RepID=A0A182MNH5_9DIPT